MHALKPHGRHQAKVLVFVPRWRDASERLSGMPYRVFPVLDPLLHARYEVELLIEPPDRLVTDELAAALARAEVAVCWCAELHPGLQIPGILQFLQQSKGHAHRILGGGFLTFDAARALQVPDDLMLVHGSENGCLAAAVAERLEHDPVEPRQRLGVDAAMQVELASLARPEPHLMGNDLPTLQLPTGLGCGKSCAFCFYEQAPWRAVAADDIVRLAAHARQRFGIEQFLMGELDFFASKRRALQVADGLLRHAADVRWFALGSVQDLAALTDDELARCYASGLRCVEMGTEVGDDDARRRLGKTFSAATARATNVRLHQSGITPLHNILLGCPDESPAERRATLQLVDALCADSDGAARFNFRRYQPIPGTTMGERALRGAPPLPTALDDVQQLRLGEGRRAMPWLDEASERDVLQLTDNLLPIGYDPGPFARPTPAQRRAARERCRDAARSPRSTTPLAAAGLTLPQTYQP